MEKLIDELLKPMDLIIEKTKRKEDLTKDEIDYLIVLRSLTKKIKEKK